MKEVKQLEVRDYITGFGKKPFVIWINSLKNKQTQSIIWNRVYRLHSGNLGDCRYIIDGIYELRIHYGAGYRAYFGKEGNTVVVLLCGGNKSDQQKDIQKAKEYWQDYNQRKI